MNKTSQLLKLLKARPGKHISGEDLSAKLAVSRTAIWKHIHHLEDAGYKIDAVQNLGYRLVSVPDRMLPDEITAGLKTADMGREIYCYRQTSSTNDRAIELARDGKPEGTLVVAEHQNQGRGRRERRWHSKPEANLLFTLLFRPVWTAEDASWVTMIMAVAVAKSIAAVIKKSVEIKWPNDILISGAKVAGILTEMQAQTERIEFVACGVGINVNDCPSRDLVYPANSLASIAGTPVERVGLLQHILGEVESRYKQAQSRGIRTVWEEWQALSCLQGKRVELELPQKKKLRGIVQGIDTKGALLVLDEEHTVTRVVSGEVIHARPR